MRQGLAYGVDLVVMMDIRKHGEFAFEFGKPRCSAIQTMLAA
jgi:hypothetical protein